MSTHHKKIVLVLEGTWLSPIEAAVVAVRNSLGIGSYSNIALMAQALESYDQDMVPQIAYSQSRVEARIGGLAGLVAEATGYALHSDLVAAYEFLVDNYAEGDDIYLFGFSRGAYIARALSAFIDYAGIMKKSQRGLTSTIFAAYTRRSFPKPSTCRHSAEILHKYTHHWPGREAIEREKDVIIRNTGSHHPEDDLRNHWTIPPYHKRVRPPPIKVIGVFDTVGALGIPGAFDLPIIQQQFEFFDTDLSGNVQYAYHALALNEDRKDFRPTLWTVRADKKQAHQVVKQCWFKGSYPDVGGGFYEHGLSDITLAWMVAQLMDDPDGPHLIFNLELIKKTQDRTRVWGAQPAHPTRLPFMFRHERQVLRLAPPTERSQEESVVNTSAGTLPNSSSLGDRAADARLQTFKPTAETLHHSVTIGHDVQLSSSNFQSLRSRNISKLRNMWEQAQDNGTLLPTEQELKWTETQTHLQPLSIAYGAVHGLVSPSRSTRFHAFVELIGALVTMAYIVSSFVTYVPARLISLLFTFSLSTENLVGGAAEECARGVGAFLEGCAGGLGRDAES